LSSALRRFPGTLKCPSKARAPYTNGYADLHRLDNPRSSRTLPQTGLYVPSLIPPGWSASWEHWDYSLRLPQIEMLVDIKYAIPAPSSTRTRASASYSRP
jgi:hypothetical protein